MPGMGEVDTESQSSLARLKGANVPIGATDGFQTEQAGKEG